MYPLENEGNTVLEKAKKTAAKSGVPLVTHMKQGHAGTEIIALAQQEKVDLIVSGSTGKVRPIVCLSGVSAHTLPHTAQ